MSRIRGWKIQAAFRSKLIAIPDIPDELAWENRGYNPKEDSDGDPVPYIEENFIPGDEGFTANEEIEQVGVMQYDVYYPSGSGTKDVRNAADNIKDAFEIGTVLDGFVRCDQPSVTNGDADPPWFRLIVRIPYTCYGILT